MSTLADLRAGDIMFARKVRPWTADLLILAGQLSLGEPGYPHHVAVVTRAARQVPPFELPTTETGAVWIDGHRWERPKIVQAMPSGAEEIEIGAEHWTKDYIYVRPAYGGMANLLQRLHARTGQSGQHHFEQRERTVADAVAAAARRYIGTPYSFADYLAIEGVHLGIKNGPIRRYVTTSKHMICSQLADQAMCDAGFHVFNDGRLPQDVTPSALYKQMLDEMPGKYLIPSVTDGWWDTGV